MSKNFRSNLIVFSIFFFGTCIGIFIYSNFFKFIRQPIASTYKNFQEGQIPDSLSGGGDKATKSILIFGDLMIDRNVANRIDEFGTDYPFINIKEILEGSDIVVANLEGVFTHNTSISREDHNILRFTFDKKLIPMLTKYNFSVLSQANNHTNDFGLEGAEESKKLLLENNILTFGDFLNKNDDVVVKEIGRQEVVFIGFNEFSYANKENVFKLIKKYKLEGYKVIVMPHWGTEYEPLSNESQRELAGEFVLAGADAVIGAHPHVVQEIEIYKGKPIFYSLGNFVFDQDFSKATTEGLGVKIVFYKNKTSITLIPFNITKSQVNLKNGEEYKKFLEELSIKSSEEIRAEILKGQINL